MSYVLDTHALIWWVLRNEELSPTAYEAMRDRTAKRFVSAVTAYEIVNKVELGKMPEGKIIAENLTEILHDNGWQPLPIAFAHAELAARLPTAHRDPFDRMLAAQAMIEDLHVITIDAKIRDLGAKVLW